VKGRKLSRNKRLIGAVVTLLVVGAGIVFLASRSLAPASDGALTQTFTSPTGFTLRYPDNWETAIPMSGLMVAGMRATLYENQPGATFTVQRSQPFEVYGTLDEALDQYLRRGPLRADRAWTVINEITPTTFDGHDALIVDIQGKENEASPELRAHILTTTADNTFVYLLILTAPAADWSAHEPTLRAMLDSLEIIE
jgi:hypothetical protein